MRKLRHDARVNRFRFSGIDLAADTVSVLGEPGHHPARDTFADIKTSIPPDLGATMVAAFGFEVVADSALP